MLIVYISFPHSAMFRTFFSFCTQVSLQVGQRYQILVLGIEPSSAMYKASVLAPSRSICTYSRKSLECWVIKIRHKSIASLLPVSSWHCVWYSSFTVHELVIVHELDPRIAHNCEPKDLPFRSQFCHPFNCGYGTVPFHLTVTFWSDTVQVENVKMSMTLYTVAQKALWFQLPFNVTCYFVKYFNCILLTLNHNYEYFIFESGNWSREKFNNLPDETASKWYSWHSNPNHWDFATIFSPIWL